MSLGRRGVPRASGWLARLLLVLSCAAGATGGMVGAAPAGAATTAEGTYDAAAALTGPITTGHIIEPETALPSGLSTYGYVEKEYFASGTASAFLATSEPSDGRWSIRPTTTASYRTRILVRRPADAAKFNGTVVVEWMNVSSGESAPDWDYLNPELMREGYAYVAVSAQALGVDGGNAILGTVKGAPSGGLVHNEPARYGTLHHPGDQYALDMYAQIGNALKVNKNVALRGLHPTHYVAVGESQSAFYLTTFADAIQPLTNTFDGIFIHSRGGSGAPLNGTAISVRGPNNLWIRTDLKVPVFMFETQTDLIQLGYATAVQPNTARIRAWEVAGTSHADAYLVGSAAKLLGCTTPVNDGPQHPVVQAAFAAFARWVTAGTPPSSPPPFQLASTNPAALALDAHGNVIGGVRTPQVDVPVSTLSGAPPKGSTPICSLFGSTIPFSGSTLTSLYGTKQSYVTRYEHSLDQAIAAGFILPADRAGLLAQAAHTQFPS
jgi:Alpha/beta hydrolase domain